MDVKIENGNRIYFFGTGSARLLLRRVASGCKGKISVKQAMAS